MNDELLRKMNKVRNNLITARTSLESTKNIIKESILINNDTFKNENFTVINNKLSIQINSLNKKIIPKIKDM